MKEIVRATSDAAGLLDIEFSDGARLSVTVHPEFEAWEANAEGGTKVVVLPGGGFAIWPAFRLPADGNTGLHTTESDEHND